MNGDVLTKRACFTKLPPSWKEQTSKSGQQPSQSPPGGFRATRLGGEWPAAGSTYHESNCMVAGRDIRARPCPQSPVSQRQRLVAQTVYSMEFMNPFAFQAERDWVHEL